MFGIATKLIKYLDTGLKKYLHRRGKTVAKTMFQLGRPRLIDVLEDYDTNEYIRLSTLELCGQEIIRKNVAGAIAEVGVYQGTFAAKMNALLPERTFYLFDTFTGFDKDQERFDNKYHGKTITRDFTNTTIELVLSKMNTPQRCVIKKGLFPSTAEGVNEIFCFVSLDADLSEPTYQGLKWFWPRMVQGGYILVHDYNNCYFPGVLTAVNRFSSEFSVPFTPVSDVYGSAIFAKY